MSLPFLPDLHSEIMKAWDKPYSARIHRYKHANYADIEGRRERGYASMPPRGACELKKKIKSLFFNLDRVLLGFLSFKRVLLLKSPLSRAPLRSHYWCIGSIVSKVRPAGGAHPVVCVGPNAPV